MDLWKYILALLILNLSYGATQRYPLFLYQRPLAYFASPTYYHPLVVQGQPLVYSSPMNVIVPHLEVPSSTQNKDQIPILSATKPTSVQPTSYLIVAHCAKALSTVYDLFLDFDINADTKISKGEFNIGVKRMKSNLSYTLPWIKFLVTSMSEVDKNMDDILNFEEFKNWYSTFIDRVVFKYYDANGDGYIDKMEYNQEFSDNTTKPAIGIEEFDVSGMVSPSGVDGPDGKLDYHEFILSARKIPGIHQKFPGISEFMSSFLDMFCSEKYY